jgi:hypothetical protein
VTEKRYVLGIDIGQANDPTAVAILEHEYRTREPTYALRALHRYRLGTPYPNIVADITNRLLTPPLSEHSIVAIDSTGVGAPIVDLFKQHPRLGDICAITITGGTSIGGSGYQLTVPKRDLINTTAILLQQRRLRIAGNLPDTPALINELLNYRFKTSDSGHQSYAPATSQDHDDLLIALSLALWRAKHRPAIFATTHVPQGRIPTAEDRFLPWF